MSVRVEDISLLPEFIRKQIAAQTGHVHPIDQRPTKARGAAAPKQTTDQAPLFLQALSKVGTVQPLHETPGLWQTPAGLMWRNYAFSTERGWEFDWAEPVSKTAVEVDGGRWKSGGGRHSSDGDRDKLNTANASGWAVLRFSPTQLNKQPDACVAFVREAIGRQKVTR
jgi:hypothetical protein